eukprot:TRINITY_DN22403_c0_g1_i1.p1 TRINITY_DN22403_c0_g1~~TRINITY_DN22403_c0_g1_i1.p1  ORF type:complete len:122 (+),score=33.15 TRINITY_DN22403_c0_g1_i1:168-533(+)
MCIRDSEIASFDEVRKLSRLKNLRTLWLADNPVAALPQYRYKVLQFCPKLEVLDTVEVTPQERAEAAKLPGLPPSSSTSSTSAVPVSRPAPVQALSLIHISEPTRLLSISYAVFCLKKKKY